MGEAVSNFLNEETPYGTLLVDLDLHMLNGPNTQHKAVNPLALLFKAFHQGGGFTTEMQRIIDGNSYDKPLGLILYADEVTPGKELAHDNKRKIWLAYFSFDELSHVHHKEDSWLPLLCLRSSVVNKTRGNISQAFNYLLLMCL